MLRCRRSFVYLFLELNEEAIFETPVIIQPPELIGPGRPELPIQLRQVPGLKVGPCGDWIQMHCRRTQDTTDNCGTDDHEDALSDRGNH